MIKNLSTFLLDTIQNVLFSVGQYVSMVWDVLTLMCTRFIRWDLVVRQLYEIGVRSVPLVCLTGLATGMVLAAQAFFQLSDKGLAGTTGIMVAKSMLVEIGPLLASFMITGRVGAAMCAELGSMRVTEQVDAMASMGVHPLEYLVIPRYVAMAFMMPILTIFSSTCGIFGGWFLSTSLYGMNSQTFFDPLPIYITWFDISSNIIKSWTFGIIIVSIACFRGLTTRGGAAGVGRATTSSVVVSYTSILAANFLLTVFFNAVYWYVFGFQ